MSPHSLSSITLLCFVLSKLMLEAAKMDVIENGSSSWPIADTAVRTALLVRVRST